jgi:hypothetical protein
VRAVFQTNRAVIHRAQKAPVVRVRKNNFSGGSQLNRDSFFTGIGVESRILVEQGCDEQRREYNLAVAYLDCELTSSMAGLYT